MPQDTERLYYRLPVTVARFSGAVITTTDALKPPGSQKEVARTGSAIIDVRADSRPEPSSLALGKPELEKLTTTVRLLEDGRLTGAESTIDARSEERWTAILSAAAFAGSAALPLVAVAGPVGGAAAAGLAVTAGISAAVRTRTLAFARERDGAEQNRLGELLRDYTESEASRGRAAVPSRVPEPSAEDLGIDPRFADQHPLEYHVLYRYRLALVRTTYAHAQIATEAFRTPDESAITLRDYERILKSTRQEASRIEETYKLWLESKRTPETRHEEWQLYVDELPTQKAFAQRVAAGGSAADEGPNNDPSWWTIAQTIGLMVTCDLLQSAPSLETAPPPTPRFLFGRPLSPARRAIPSQLDSDDGTMLYRQPLHAEMTTWRLVKRATGAQSWKQERSDWILVTHPSDTRRLKLPLDAKKDMKLSFSFAESGALKEVTSDVTGRAAERVEAIAALPAALRDAAKAGSEFGAAVSPAAARAGALKQRLEEAQTRKTLQGILSPAQDPLEDLREQVTQAELEARLAVARHQVVDPSSLFVITTELSSGDDE